MSFGHVRTLQSPRQTPAVDTIPIEIHWIPAHAGVPGNESAAVESKLAAENVAGTEQGFPSSGHAPGTRLMAIAKREVRARTRARWAWEWARETTGRPNQRLTKAPEKKNLRRFEGLPKAYSAVMIHMRSMRIALKHFLFKINEADSDECNCGEGSQTPKHVLLQCPLYASPRRRMLTKIRARTDLDMNKMADYDALVSNSQATRYVAKFMIQTGLLGQFRHIDAGSDSEQDEDPG